jgi:hypothetical protein
MDYRSRLGAAGQKPGFSMRIKKYFLMFASFVVIIIALIYGTYPQWFAETFLGVSELDLDFAHILRAIMGLYVAFGLFWFSSAFSDKYRDAALLTTMLFAGGLVAGRILSLFADGQPSPLLTLYIAMELVLVPVAYWVYKLPE